MGRIFTYKEISEGRVPLVSSFELLGHEIISDISACGDITGAIICGSLNQGTYTFRSDIDVMVYHNKSARAEETLKELKLQAETLHLELNFIEVTPDTIDDEFYNINWNFYQHLQLAAETGGLIKQNFLPSIDLGEINTNKELIDYINFKLNYFEANPIEEALKLNVDDAKSLGVLRKALEIPVHIARKYIWLTRGMVLADDKEAVCEDYAKIAPPILGMYLRLLFAADKEYTKLVERQLINPDKADYERTIAGLASLIPQIKAFAYENALLLEQSEETARTVTGFSVVPV